MPFEASVTTCAQGTSAFSAALRGQLANVFAAIVFAILAIWTLVYATEPGPDQLVGIVNTFALASVAAAANFATAASRISLRFEYAKAPRSVFSSMMYPLS